MLGHGWGWQVVDGGWQVCRACFNLKNLLNANEIPKKLDSDAIHLIYSRETNFSAHTPIMQHAEQRSDLLNIFLSNTPLLDVRAPVEFAQGSFPGAVNLPLMNNEERHEVGIRYKEAGQQSAIELGHSLVAGEIKDRRIQSWVDFANAHPDGVLYCFRGGLRSRITQQWLHEAGVDYPRITGGYKAMRRFLIDATERLSQQTRFVIVGGMTGSGKTDVIAALTRTIDLEGLAHHRGSSFGGHPDHQPSQIDFENALAIALLRQESHHAQSLVLEDESHLIGRCAIPDPLLHKMHQSPRVWVVEPLEIRVQRIERDYIRRLLTEYEERHTPDVAWEKFATHLTRSLFNLRKRLGMQRYAALNTALQVALNEQIRDRQSDAHASWIRPLITDYYDPMYTYQRTQRAVPTLFEGNCQEVTAYLQTQGY